MEHIVKIIAASLPLIFAFAFLVPLFDQSIQAMGLSMPFGLTSLTVALIVGGGWGLIAQVGGRWI